MYPLSDTVSAALKKDHQSIFKCEVYDSGVLKEVLKVVGGNVEVDDSADRRRRCRVGLMDPTGTLTPAGLESLLAPNGNELRLYRGVLTSIEEYIPLGVFVSGDVDVVDTGNGVMIDITGQDRSRKVSRARWEQAFVIPSGTNVATAIRDIIANRLPGTTFSFATTARTTPLILLGEQRDNDPWKDASDIATAAGMELFFDADGVCVLRPVPDPTVDPVVWQYHDGDAGRLVAINRKLTSENTYNAVVVTGEGSGLAAPIRVMVVDNNPLSPTYVGNPIGSSDFGFVPRFLTSSLITTTAQATDAGNAQLRKSLGGIEDVRFDGIVNPGHEAGDIIEIKREKVKVNAKYALTSFTIPLDVATPFSGSTRKRNA